MKTLGVILIVLSLAGATSSWLSMKHHKVSTAKSSVMFRQRPASFYLERGIPAGILARQDAAEAELKRAKGLESSGDFKSAESAYRKLMESGGTGEGARLGLARVLLTQDRPSEALEIASPLVYRGVQFSIFDGVEIYESSLRKLGRESEIKAFRDSIRDNSLDGFSLAYYNKEGLTDDQAMAYIRAGFEFGRGNTKGAEIWFRKAVADYPNSPEAWGHLATVLASQGRKGDVVPLYEDWYRHADLKTRQYMKVHYVLDFQKLDAEGLP